MEAICKLCGKPVLIDASSIPEEAREIVMRMASGLVHDECKLQATAKDARERQARDQAEQLARRMAEWGGVCPPLFQDTDASRLPAVFARVMAWTYGPRGLCIGGQTGKSKTRMVFKLLEREFFAGRAVVAITHPDFSFQAVRLSMGNPDVASRWEAIVTRCDILFIDDLGKARFTTSEGGAKHGEETLWRILEARWTHKLPCFFTMNATGDELVGRMSKDVANPFLRRLREFCEVISVK